MGVDIGYFLFSHVLIFITLYFLFFSQTVEVIGGRTEQAEPDTQQPYPDEEQDEQEVAVRDDDVGQVVASAPEARAALPLLQNGSSQSASAADRIVSTALSSVAATGEASRLLPVNEPTASQIPIARTVVSTVEPSSTAATSSGAVKAPASDKVWAIPLDASDSPTRLPQTTSVPASVPVSVSSPLSESVHLAAAAAPALVENRPSFSSKGYLHLQEDSGNTPQIAQFEAQLEIAVTAAAAAASAMQEQSQLQVARSNANAAESATRCATAVHHSTYSNAVSAVARRACHNFTYTTH